ncbi:MAG TPA: hypothetical protein VFB96_17020, partial [Pirellulaceae bacterium]|nr:hypothetical protein [Pirellulaceae bacterium]
TFAGQRRGDGNRAFQGPVSWSEISLPSRGRRLIAAIGVRGLRASLHDAGGARGTLRPWVETHGYLLSAAPRRRHMSQRGHLPRSGVAMVAGPFKARYRGAKFRSRRGATIEDRRVK